MNLAENTTQETPMVDTTAQAAPAPKETVLETSKNETKPEITKDVQAEKYELKLSEGSHLDAQHMEKIVQYAKERGLSKDVAQELLDRENSAVAGFVTKQQEEIKTKTGAWLGAIKADKEIGGDAFEKTVEIGKRVVQKFGSPAFIQALNETGLGNHPELVRFVARIGKAYSEDQLVIPGNQTSTKKRAIEDVLYGGKN